MEKYTVRKAEERDIARVMELFDESRKIMRANGNMTQWINGYPTVETLRKDMDGGNAYVITAPELVEGYFAFIPGVEPTYSYVEGGQWLNDAPYATIHRLASRPETHGIAQACFDYCWSRCKNLKIDTHEDNKIMKHCIEKYGFVYCGVIYLKDGSPRVAFQKSE